MNRAVSKDTVRYTSGQKDPIAIIGIGCRFPGGVDSPEKFWSLLYNGINAVTEIPSDRIDIERYFDPRPATPGKMMTRWGGFLENIDGFDANFFGISPREADRLDPQQRLLLETAWNALEDAGQVPDKLKGSQTAVFVGLWLSDYEARLFADPNLTDFYMTTGSGRYSASGRISYFLGLQGPSITIDTACSSSLVAIYLACQSLWSGDTGLALAGGANVILQPHISIAYSQSKMMAPDGRCKFGDAQADGYVRSEGAGIVVLKRLSDAIADGDPIYAVIRGGAVNNDGQTSGFLTTPGQAGQEEMLRLAYRSAGVDPRDVQYVEAHGTGTRAGDPVEVGALGAVLGSDRGEGQKCLVGSVKTNLGHTEGAAGVAGLIKVALSLKNGVIPPSLHLNEFNPDIPWGEMNLSIPRELTPWRTEEDVIAGVSAFGIAGTNAHIVLANAPRNLSSEIREQITEEYLLPISAQTPRALKELADSYHELLVKENVPVLYDLCYTASSRHTHHAERLSVIGRSPRELADQLAAFLSQESLSESKTIVEKPKVVFVFPGQGAQWLGMGRELLKQNTVFAETLRHCDHAIRLWSDWSLLEQLALDENASGYRLNEISVIQPTLFAMEIALAAVWRFWGVEPAAVVGHSMGEVAAAYIAGALSLEDATKVICKRSQLMQRTSGQGAMAVIGLPYDETEKLLAGFESKLSIAVQNSPKSTVISGSPGALELLMKDIQAREIFCRPIKVDVASHSPQMDVIRPELVASLNGIVPQTITIPFYSTVTQDILEGKTLDAEYWGQNLRQPVRFGQTIARLLNDEYIIFIEMSPHPILLSSIEDTRAALDVPAYGFASLHRDQPELASMLTELGSLYTLGYEVDWEKLYPNGGQVVTLPGYPWQREHYWFETSASSSQTRPGAHPLLGQYIRLATGEHIWETAISTKRFTYLNDHQVRGSVVLPAAAYMEMAMAAVSEVYGSKPCLIQHFSFQEAFVVPKDDDRIMQLVLISDTAEFHFYSRADQTESPDAWVLHASGNIKPTNEASVDNAMPAKDFSHQQAAISAQEFYSSVAARGLEYGSNFQAIAYLSQTENGVLAKIKFPDDLIPHTAKYLLHPVLIDACFQVLLSILPVSNEDTYLPISLDGLHFHTTPDFGNEFWCYVTQNSSEPDIAGDLILFNENGQVIMTAYGLCLQRIEKQPADIHDFLYEIQWQESAIPFYEPSESKHWLIFADQQGIGNSLAKNLQGDSQICTLVFPGKEYRSIDAGVHHLDPWQPAHFQQLLMDVAQPIHYIVHLWSLDNELTPSIEDPNLASILYLTQAITQVDSVDSPCLWLGTRGTQTVHTQPEPVSVSQSPVWGMGAVIANEFPRLHCTRVDLSPKPSEGEVELLARTLLSTDDEDQVALRNRQRYVARLKRIKIPVGNEAENVIKQKMEKDQPFRLFVTDPGMLDHLSIQSVLRRSPKAGEVEIAVKATGLNFMNVMAVLGILPGYKNGVGPLGIECSGVVTRVGEKVTEFQIGDEVAGIAFDCLASHAVTDVRLVVKKPSFMNFEEAATIPIAYVTAYYALHSLGRVQAGERVLIHAATGGVGLAAIQLAKRAGAEIYATAGSIEKREYLSRMGITHVFDSRSLTFAEEILKETQKEGVDIVLNSLAGRAIAKGLEILKPYGRFLEIGKRDIYENSKVGLLPFQRNLSYSAIDLDKMSRERPDIVGRMLHDVFHLIETREITALPLQSFPVSKANDAFRLMAQAKHIGKIVIQLDDADAFVELPARTTSIRSDGTYLITGGLGGLGLAFARSLAQQGARHLVLMGRSKPSASAQNVIDELRSAGVEVLPAQADVTDIDQLSTLFEKMKATLPPLRGIIHAAGLLSDGTIQQMDWERFKQAFAPKVLGAWNLHTLTLDQPLDFFILFSSAASILGIPGQINYAAGNAFLDALARFRREQNLTSLSINWGPWSEIGLASSQANRGARLIQQGLKSISPAEGLDAMSVVMAQADPQISVMSLDAKRWCVAQPTTAHSGLFKELLNQTNDESEKTSQQNKSIRTELLAVHSGKQRRILFETHIREQVAHVLRITPSRIPVDKPFRTLGLDSLMSIELRNRLEDSLNTPISAGLIWNYPTVHVLASFIAEKIGISFDENEGSASDRTIQVKRATSDQETTESDTENLSKAELDALLKEELDALEDLLGDN